MKTFDELKKELVESIKLEDLKNTVKDKQTLYNAIMEFINREELKNFIPHIEGGNPWVYIMKTRANIHLGRDNITLNEKLFTSLKDTRYDNLQLFCSPQKVKGIYFMDIRGNVTVINAKSNTIATLKKCFRKYVLNSIDTALYLRKIKTARNQMYDLSKYNNYFITDDNDYVYLNHIFKFTETPKISCVDVARVCIPKFHGHIIEQSRAQLHISNSQISLGDFSNMEIKYKTNTIEDFKNESSKYIVEYSNRTMQNLFKI